MSWLIVMDIIIVRADLALKISCFIQIVKLLSNSSPTSLGRPYSPMVKEDFSEKFEFSKNKSYLDSKQ